MALAVRVLCRVATLFAELVTSDALGFGCVKELGGIRGFLGVIDGGYRLIGIGFRNWEG